MARPRLWSLVAWAWGHHRSVREIPDTDERRRLREELFDPFTCRQLARIGVTNGWQCLDAGAGRGSIAQWLAERAGAEGHVVAVDIDSALLGTIPDAAFEARRHDLATDGPVGEGYDLVHSRFVLEHLPNRDQVLVELATQMRPGGWLVIQDAEFSTTALADSSMYAAAMIAFEQAMNTTGADYRWTRTLPAALSRLGLLDVHANAEVAWFHGGSDHARFWASNLDVMRSEMLAAGLDESVYERALDALFDPDQWLPSIMVLAVSGRRP